MIRNALGFLGQNAGLFLSLVLIVSIVFLFAFILWEIYRTSQRRKRKKEILRRALEWKRIRQKKTETLLPEQETEKPVLLYIKMRYLRQKFQRKK